MGNWLSESASNFTPSLSKQIPMDLNPTELRHEAVRVQRDRGRAEHARFLARGMNHAQETADRYYGLSYPGEHVSLAVREVFDLASQPLVSFFFFLNGEWVTLNTTSLQNSQLIYYQFFCLFCFSEWRRNTRFDSHRLNDEDTF